MGELKDALAPALSSTNRAKKHWRGRRLCLESGGN
jgi:hypothetical protein